MKYTQRAQHPQRDRFPGSTGIRQLNQCNQWFFIPKLQRLTTHLSHCFLVCFRILRRGSEIGEKKAHLLGNEKTLISLTALIERQEVDHDPEPAA